MKQTLIVAAAALALMTAASTAATTTTPKPPAGYVYLADGKLVRFPGPGMVYDATDKLVPRPFACAAGSSSAPVPAGGKTSVGFPCDNIYAGLVQLPN